MLLDEFALYKHLALSLYTLAPKYLYAVLRMKVFLFSCYDKMGLFFKSFPTLLLLLLYYWVLHEVR